MAATFYYDFNSPYAYLASARMDAVLGTDVLWQPVAFAFVLQAQNREPWSFHEPTRTPGVAEVRRRAADYDLPPITWPPGWPIESYTLASLRAAVVAEDRGLLRAYSDAAFARNFVSGEGLGSLDDVLTVAESVGLDRDLVAAGVKDADVKQRLAERTRRFIAAGGYGVPTVEVDGALFWGDDRLEEAAAQLR